MYVSYQFIASPCGRGPVISRLKVATVMGALVLASETATRQERYDLGHERALKGLGLRLCHESVSYERGLTKRSLPAHTGSLAQ
jgi:hypothetical protein